VGSPVTVMVGTQKLTTQVAAGGTWSVTPAALADGPITVTASVTDAAGNTGAATQALTVAASTSPQAPASDWVANYAAPIIQGTTDAAVGTQVRVTIASQVLTTSVKTGGLWGLRLNPMPNATYAVSIAVTDSEDKTGSATQNLRIDTNLGALASGSSTSCGALSLNREVIVAVSTKTLNASIAPMGVWTIAPTSAASCGLVVVASVADPAGDTGMFSRVPVGQNPAPSVTIAGGAAASATSLTISGTTSAPVGSKVVIRYSEQTLTTSVAADGTWTIVRNPLSAGIHQVVVAVTSAAGTGYAMQMLTTK
jgi:protein-S-isoprenylcysteine O-methyltransferase Ste14